LFWPPGSWSLSSLSRSSPFPDPLFADPIGIETACLSDPRHDSFTFWPGLAERPVLRTFCLFPRRLSVSLPQPRFSLCSILTGIPLPRPGVSGASGDRLPLLVFSFDAEVLFHLFEDTMIRKAPIGFFSRSFPLRLHFFNSAAPPRFPVRYSFSSESKQPPPKPPAALFFVFGFRVLIKSPYPCHGTPRLIPMVFIGFLPASRPRVYACL